MTWIKFCGIVRPEDFELAVELGVDAVGIIAVPETPRCVSISEAAVLGKLPRGSTQLVLVFQNPDLGYGDRMIDAAGPDLLQFHGAETPEFASRFGRPYIKTIRDLDEPSVSLLRQHHDNWAWMLDCGWNDAAMKPRWIELRQVHRERRVILAGGLTDENVSEAIACINPWGVDVSRGIEREPRVKDHNLMRRFRDAVRAESA